MTDGTAGGTPHVDVHLEVEVDVLVVGAGQAGRGTGHWLARDTDLSCRLIDGPAAAGESWRRRWDSASPHLRAAT